MVSYSRYTIGGHPVRFVLSSVSGKNVGFAEQSASELSGGSIPSLCQLLRPEESAATRRRPGSSRGSEVAPPRDFRGKREGGDAEHFPSRLGRDASPDRGARGGAKSLSLVILIVRFIG